MAAPPSSGPKLMDKQWETVQRKTFTKWVNTQLAKQEMSPIEDLGSEFSDGVKLIQLLEIIGDEPLGKYYKAPKLRIQKCENISKALDFIKKRGVNLTNIGPEDLVDKNEKLVLGMIWTIILRFSIADITAEGLSAKEGLLLWCQRKTAGYRDVNVKDFTVSWQDGLAFCALIHRFRPDLIDFDSLDKNNRKENVELAFEVAETQLGISRLLDVEDLVDMVKPDERSVMTYVAQYFHAFAAFEKIITAGRRVAKFVAVAKSVWEMQHDYENRARQFTSNIAEMKRTWDESTFDGTYVNAKKQSVDLINYKNTIKREWITENRELNTLLGNIQTKLVTYNLSPYSPPEGLQLSDLTEAWSSLLAAEAARRKVINEKLASIKEELRVTYSNLANDFEKDISSISQRLGAVEGELEGQLELVKSLLEQLQQLEGRLSQIKDADLKCEEAGLDESEREYTVFTIDDLTFDLEVVRQSLIKKESFIENQIVARSMTNLTPQQLEEFESTFRMFDKNGSNTLSKHELKACLAAFGANYSDEEMDSMFMAITSGEDITFEQFIKLMVSITEDRTTAEQLLQSFQTIAGGKNFLTETDMKIGQLTADQVAYFKTVMPPSQAEADAFDYEVYLQQVFSK